MDDITYYVSLIVLTIVSIVEFFINLLIKKPINTIYRKLKNKQIYTLVISRKFVEFSRVYILISTGGTCYEIKRIGGEDKS